MAFTHALATNNYGTAKLIVATSAANGTHTTLASAIADASVGDTIFLRDSVTENVTLTPGVNIAAFAASAANTPKITGTVTMSAAGTSTISGIILQTNSAAAIAITGTAASILYIKDCYLNFTNSTGITFSVANTSAVIYITDCRGDLGTTGIAIFTHTSNGSMQIVNTFFSNTGGSSTASTCSSGGLDMSNTQLTNPVTTSSTGAGTWEYCLIFTVTQNVTAATLGGGSLSCKWCRFQSGSASAISIGGTSVFLEYCDVASSNTNAITGAGTLTYSPIAFSGTSSTINTTTQVLYNVGPSQTVGSSNSGGTNTLTITNSSNTSSSRANVTASVGGTSSEDGSFSSVITGGQTWSWGGDNSASDAFVISANASLGTTNIMSVSTAGEINYPLQPAFFAINSATDADVTGDATSYTVIFDTEIFDQNADYNNGTGVFTAPVTGRYQFNTGLFLQGLLLTHTISILSVSSSNRIVRGSAYNLTAGIPVGNLDSMAGVLLDMDANDTCSIVINVQGGTKVVDVYGEATNGITFFSGILLA